MPFSIVQLLCSQEKRRRLQRKSCGPQVCILKVLAVEGEGQIREGPHNPN